MFDQLYIKKITNQFSEKSDDKKPAMKNEDESDNKFDNQVQELIINIQFYF